MALVSPADLVSALRVAGLLDAAELAEATRLQTMYPDARSLASALIQRGWLRPYQINQLFLGRGADLVLGAYILLERLGEGGMGTVFKARQRGLGRIVAVKVIRKDRLANAQAVKRFHREIRAAAQLEHPNIVRAFDADDVGGTHLLVMEFVDN
ncbi:MAG: serine/threonine protein kinase, partial [Planctomycetes bacterium]|nr:serine/threonine protein kinase [Planctomycetota bacterium]